jgi:hypothetical protein
LLLSNDVEERLASLDEAKKIAVQRFDVSVDIISNVKPCRNSTDVS